MKQAMGAMARGVKWFLERCFDRRQRAFPLVKITLIIAFTVIILVKMPSINQIVLKTPLGYFFLSHKEVQNDGVLKVL